MTGREILIQALMLLNYTNSDGIVDDERLADIDARGLAIVNTVYSECARAEGKRAVLPVSSLFVEIPLGDEALRDVMPLGVAAMVALGENDQTNQAVFASMFNDKIRRLHPSCERVDVWGCGL